LADLEFRRGLGEARGAGDSQKITEVVPIHA
jgi:hypothetical protein